MTRTSIFITTLFGACLLAALSTSILFKPFWLDECITVWATSGSFSDLIARIHDSPGQSVLYFIIVWCWRQLFGASEFALRVPSLCGVMVASYGVYVISRRYTQQQAALVATASLFSCTLIIHAFSARPYGLALAATVWSVEFLFRAVRVPGWNQWWWYVAATLIAAVHLHYLFSAIVIVHLSFLAVLPRAEIRARLIKYSSVLFLTALAAFPIARQLLELSSHRAALSFAQSPSFDVVFSIAHEVPVQLALIAVLIGLSIAAQLRKFDLQIVPRAEMIAFISWLVIPWILFASVSIFLGIAILLPRYLLWAFPAFSLLAAIGAQRVTNDLLRNTLCAVALVMLTAINLNRAWDWEDWRGAAEIIREKGKEGEPVLLYSGLVELKDESIVQNKTQWDYLDSPFQVYPVRGAVYPLAHAEKESPMFRRDVLPTLLAAPEFLFAAVVWQPGSPENPVARLVSFLRPEGFVATPLRMDGPVWVVKMERKNPLGTLRSATPP